MKNIDYQLRQFVKVARHKSLSDAAVDLNVTQSALSKQLREIELAVGHRVFRRHGRGIELTEQGHLLWRSVQAAYKIVDTTVSQIKAMRSGTAGTLKVATLCGRSHSVAYELAVTVFGKRPDIDLTMMECSAMDVCRLVEAGIVDVGFVEHTAAIPDTLEIRGIIGGGYHLSDIDGRTDASDAIRVGERQVTGIAGVLCTKDNSAKYEIVPHGQARASINCTPAIARPAVESFSHPCSEHSESHGRQLVAIARKTEQNR
ncbi:LysR family transcriptional regulator [Paraburkholderia solisilvae]|nr:LysR family transcriptional regulator [Paraburkholderia solisilvae]